MVFYSSKVCNYFEGQVESANLPNCPSNSSRWLRNDKHGVHQCVKYPCSSENFEDQIRSSCVGVGEAVQKSNDEEWQNILQIIQMGSAKTETNTMNYARFLKIYIYIYWGFYLRTRSTSGSEVVTLAFLS